jgi:putative ABC transport system permease protein
MWAEYFRIAFKTFGSQKKRTFLTLLGIFIGIAAVVSLISLGQGLKYSIDRQFSLLGADKIFVQPGTGGGVFGISTVKLTSDDLLAIKSVPGVDIASASVYKIAKVKFGNQIKYTFVIGIDDSEQSFADALESFGVEIIKGQGADGTREAVMPYRFSNADFFDRAVEVGSKLVIEDKKFKVVGEVNRIGNPQDDSQVFITIGAAKDVFGATDDELDYIMVSLKDGASSDDLAEKIKKKLRNTRNVDDGDEDFSVMTADDLMKTFGIVLTIVQIVLIGIASISLLVGGVNIANTMYTAVMERTREIGVMKAIGARNSDVFLLFLIESGLLGAAGGVVGIAIGVGLSKLVAFGADAAGWSFIQTIYPWYLIVGAFAFSFFVGAIAGTLPATQASKLKPVDALRYE